MPTWVTEDNLTDEEALFLLSEETLQAWGPYSLPMRCIMFHRRFTDKRIKPWVLRKIMFKAGIRKKKVNVLNAPRRKTARLDEFEAKITRLDDQVFELLEGGKHLIFCDECIFKARGFQDTAWAA